MARTYGANKWREQTPPANAQAPEGAAAAATAQNGLAPKNDFASQSEAK